MPLAADEIHVWYCPCDGDDAPRHLSDAQYVLSADEQHRRDRFHRTSDGDRFALAHVLLRLTLSRHADIDPADWRFETNDFDKPEIAPTIAAPPLRFNLTHTTGLIAVAVTLARDIGIDAESTKPPRAVDPLTLAERFFSIEEIAYIHGHAGAEQKAAFFKLWTLKESYIKARGQGLSIPLDSFSMPLDPATSRGIDCTGMPDQNHNWRFWQEWPTEDHAVALATPEPQDQTISVYRFDATEPEPVRRTFGQ